jgi:excisionase family DNA binding protein
MVQARRLRSELHAVSGLIMLDMISVSEAAAILGISERQVGRHRASGKLPFTKSDDGSVRLHRSHVERLVPVISDDARELPLQLRRPFRSAA